MAAKVVGDGDSTAQDDSERDVQLRNLIRKRLGAHKDDWVFTHLKKRLEVEDEDIARAYHFYDSDVWAYANEVYASQEIRFVQYLHARNPGSWHVKKHGYVNDLLTKHWPCSVVDIGFGIPQQYVLDRIPVIEGGSFTLLDKYVSALKFAECMLECIWKDWSRAISLGHIDLDGNFSVIPHDLYILLDSIEHAADPTASLKRLVTATKEDARFILSLPIGTKVPVHNIEWFNEREALDWLARSRLEVVDRKIFRPNPYVDLFAGSVEGELYNLVVECRVTD